MNKTKMTYFETDDILHFAISDEEEANSVEISPNITAELSETVRSSKVGPETVDSDYIKNSQKLQVMIQSRRLPAHRFLTADCLGNSVLTSNNYPDNRHYFF